MKRSDASRFLEAGDDALRPLGFVRRSREREWSQRVDSDRIWVHFNFGLGMVNPSFGVEYLDLRQRWPDLPGATYGTAQMLGSLFDPVHTYVSETPPERIVADLRAKGLPSANRLRERDRVVSLLQVDSPRDWPVAGYSFRIRLAPLLLCWMERPREALELAGRYAKEAGDKDQIVPDYGQFLAALRAAVAA